MEVVTVKYCWPCRAKDTVAMLCKAVGDDIELSGLAEEIDLTEEAESADALLQPLDDYGILVEHGGTI